MHQALLATERRWEIQLCLHLRTRHNHLHFNHDFYTLICSIDFALFGWFFLISLVSLPNRHLQITFFPLFQKQKLLRAFQTHEKVKTKKKQCPEPWLNDTCVPSYFFSRFSHRVIMPINLLQFVESSLPNRSVSSCLVVISHCTNG